MAETSDRAGGFPEQAPCGFPGEAVAFLRCPLCGTVFAASGRSLRCLNGHSCDVARQGYVNLLPGSAHAGTADSADMVAAREAFLAAGHFAGLRQFIAEVAEKAVSHWAAQPAPAEPPARAGPAVEDRVGTGEARADRPQAHEAGCGEVPLGCILEVGAGTGYYLAGVLDRFPGRIGLALDISKFAARRAARAHERMAAVVCDVWSRLPVADACASLILDVFAPRNPPEFRRTLRPDGVVLVVAPSPWHLRELVADLGLLKVDEHKLERLETAFGRDFTLIERRSYEERLCLTAAEAAALVAMGPSARHTQAEEVTRRLAALGDTIRVTLAVSATTYALRQA